MTDWMMIGLALVVTATAVLVLNRVRAARRGDGADE
jgi:hypothetical protein